MKAICESIEEMPRETRIVNSYSKKRPRYMRELADEGWDVYCTGALAHLSKPAKLLVRLRYSNDYYSEDVAPYFRERWGRITTKRMAAVSATKPGEVEVTADVCIATTDLAEWFERAQTHLQNRKK